MAIEWSGLSPELLVLVDRASGRPLRAQLEAGRRDAIRSGRLRGGERLPSSRELARELGVSRGIVQECFGQLLAEGYLTSRSGSATRGADVADVDVADVADSAGVAEGSAARSAAGPARPGRPARVRPEAASRSSAVAAGGSRLIADFAPRGPDLSSFP